MNVIVCKRYGFFLVFRHFLNDLGLKMVKALPFIHKPDRVARKASDVSAADWRNQTHVKNISYFFTCVVTTFLRAEILV